MAVPKVPWSAREVGDFYNSMLPPPSWRAKALLGWPGRTSPDELFAPDLPDAVAIVAKLPAPISEGARCNRDVTRRGGTFGDRRSAEAVGVVDQMFLYVYNDYFQLYHPDYLQQMLRGQIGPFPATQFALFIASTVVAIPSLMIVLTVVLKPAVGRWVNVILGLLCTVINAVSIPGAWAHYAFYNILEIALTLAVVWYAWRWRSHQLT